MSGSTSSPAGSSLLCLFHHSDNMLLLLRHHGNRSWFAVFADVPLPKKKKNTEEEPWITWRADENIQEDEGRVERERSVNRKKEQIEYENIDPTPTSLTALMYPENNA